MIRALPREPRQSSSEESPLIISFKYMIQLKEYVPSLDMYPSEWYDVEATPFAAFKQHFNYQA